VNKVLSAFGDNTQKAAGTFLFGTIQFRGLSQKWRMIFVEVDENA